MTEADLPIQVEGTTLLFDPDKGEPSKVGSMIGGSIADSNV